MHNVVIASNSYFEPQSKIEEIINNLFPSIFYSFIFKFIRYTVSGLLSMKLEIL